MTQAKLRAFYTVAELARMAGVSTKAMRRRLEAEGVELRPERPRRGQPRVVCLCQIKQAWPDLWDSMVLMQGLVDS